MRIDEAIFQHPPAVAALVLLLFILLLYYLEKRRKHEQDAQTDNQTSHYKKSATFDKRQSHPSEHEHRSTEQAYWRWQMDMEKRRDRISIVTLLLSIFAVAAAGLSFWETRVQADAAQEQIIIARDAQRAWLKFKFVKGESSTRTSDARYTWFNFNVIYKNVGLTVAEVGVFWPHVYALGAGLSSRKICDADKLRGGISSAEVVFPQDVGGDYNGRSGIEVSLEELQREADVIRNPQIRPELRMVGCLTYKYPESDVMHVTGFDAPLFTDEVVNPNDVARENAYERLFNTFGPVNFKILVGHGEFWAD